MTGHQFLHLITKHCETDCISTGFG